MSGQPSAALVAAMQDVAEGRLSPYAAAKAHHIALSTIYRSALYQQWRDGQQQQPTTKKPS